MKETGAATQAAMDGRPGDCHGALTPASPAKDGRKAMVSKDGASRARIAGRETQEMPFEHDDIERRLNLSVAPIAPGRPNRPGTPISPRFVTIHNTGNARPGADAQAHSRFVRQKGYYTHDGKRVYVSWHFTVDDVEAIRHLPLAERAWHAGERGNGQSIGVEICMQAGNDQGAANRRAALLAALLLTKLGEGPDHVVTHRQWTGKTCPALLLDEWDAFIELVTAEHANLPADLDVDAALLVGATAGAPAFPRAAPRDPDGEEPDIDHEAMIDAVL